jgi:hypothetical protein
MANRETSSNSEESTANSQLDLSYNDENDLDSSDFPTHQSSSRVWTADNFFPTHQSSSRVWTADNFFPTLYEFTGQPHIRISCTEYSHPLEYFEAFVDEAMVNHIVEETNRYQLQNPIGERRNMASWKDTSLSEM